MADLRELYQEVVIDHSKRPRNFREMEGADRVAQGYNPLCGDRITLYLKLRNGGIEDISFQGSGCAISTASASILTETLKGKTTEEAAILFDGFHDMVTGKEAPAAPLEKLAVFSKVSDYPVRVKCATLVWHTLRAALGAEKAVASTE